MIYLASPYNHADPKVRHARFDAVCRVAAKLMRGGHHLFCPIAHTHPLAECGLPKGWDFWQSYDRWFVENCDELWVVMLEGWDQSVGVTSEIAMARQLGKPVRYLTANGDEHAGV